MIFWAIGVAVFAYLLGSISFAIIFTKAFAKKDVRELGSGNAGTTNVMRSIGFLPGLLTFVCDALKGFIASYAGYLMFSYISQNADFIWAKPIYGAYLCGTFCMLGHVFPLFYKFKGGKGVATSVGIYAVCSWPAIIIGLTVFAIFLFSTKLVSLSSVIATVAVVSMSIVFRADAPILPQIIFSCLMGVIVILKHSENIKRLINGTESKVSLRRHKNG